MNIVEKQARMLELFNLLHEANNIMREFVPLNPAAFQEIYRLNSEFEAVLEAVLTEQKILTNNKITH